MSDQQPVSVTAALATPQTSAEMQAGAQAGGAGGQMQSPMFTFLWPMGPVVMGAGGQPGQFVQPPEGMQQPPPGWTGEAGGPPAAAGQAYPANVAPGQAMMAQMGMAQDPAALAANFRAPNGTGMQAMGAMAGNMPMPAGGPPGGLQPGVAAAQAWGSSSGGPYPQPTGGIIQPGKRVRSTGPPKDANGMPLFESKEEKRRRQVKEAAQRYRDKKRNAKKEGGFAEGEDMAKYKRAPQQPMDDVAQPGESKEEKRRRQLNKAAQRYREKKRRARAELPPGGLQPAQPMQVMQGQVVMPLPPGGVHVMPSPPGGLQQATAEQPPSANVLGSTMHTNMEFTPEDPAS